ncbi:hypothetical protein [Geopsychrobacter electrodiphilus]|uniref:hypothetical protein n=1 Tax=Geopsychrobacter electrodiphilus TaxID=225196 RepID=UPI00036E4267|nr:hypothetical protein [Geopsychrobacter electrodiphilus]
MHIVAVYGWQDDVDIVARIIADTLGILIFEARQKIAGGGPIVLASFADPHQAERVSTRLSEQGIPVVVVDPPVLRKESIPLRVRRFVLGGQALELEFFTGVSYSLDYDRIDLLLLGTCSSGQMQSTETVTERKFSLGKTILAGGLPMMKKVKHETTTTSEERDETLWLYAGEKSPLVFDRAALKYDGLGDAMQLSKNLNFTYLKNELRRLCPRAVYDDRLLKRAGLVRLLGPSLRPDVDIDLAFEILARSLK